MAKKQQEQPKNKCRFADRHKQDWAGPMVDYKEVDLLKKFLTTSGKMFSRKRAGTDQREQLDLQTAIKRARYMALLPYRGS